MSEEIGIVQTCAQELLRSLANISSNIQFGVGAYDNYKQQNTHYMNFQSLTQDRTAVVQAIDRWRANGGGSMNGLVALYRIATNSYNTIGWRKNAINIVFWFGDHKAQDPFITDNDGISITETATIQALTSKGIRVNAIDMESLNELGQATRVTNATGGTYTLYNQAASENPGSVCTYQANTTSLVKTIVESAQATIETEKKVVEQLSDEITVTAFEGNSTNVIQGLRKQAASVDLKRLARALADVFTTFEWESVEAQVYAEVVVEGLLSGEVEYELVVDAIDFAKNQKGCDSIYGLLSDSLLDAQEKQVLDPFINVLVSNQFQTCLVPEFLYDNLTTSTNDTLTSGKGAQDIVRSMAQSLLDPTLSVSAAQNISQYVIVGANNITNYVAAILVEEMLVAPVDAPPVAIVNLVSQGSQQLVGEVFWWLLQAGEAQNITSIITSAVRYNSSVTGSVMQALDFVLESGNKTDEVVLLAAIEDQILQIIYQENYGVATTLILGFADIGRLDEVVYAFKEATMNLTRTTPSWSTQYRRRETQLKNILGFIFQVSDGNTSANIVGMCLTSLTNSSGQTVFKDIAVDVLRGNINRASPILLASVVAELLQQRFYEAAYMSLKHNNLRIVQQVMVHVIGTQPEGMAEAISLALYNGEKNVSYIRAIIKAIGEVDSQETGMVVGRLHQLNHTSLVAVVLRNASEQYTIETLASLVASAFSYDPLFAECVALAIEGERLPNLMGAMSYAITLTMVQNYTYAGVIIPILTGAGPLCVEVCGEAFRYAVYGGKVEAASNCLAEALDLASFEQNGLEGLANLYVYILKVSDRLEEINILVDALVKNALKEGILAQTSTLVMAKLLVQEKGYIIMEALPRIVRKFDNDCSSIIGTLSGAITRVDVSKKPTYSYIEYDTIEEKVVQCGDRILECFNSQCCQKYENIGDTCKADLRSWKYVGRCSNQNDTIILQPHVGYPCFCSLK
eukprot:TRINITY_DN871_c0_g1_i2.p1 TRINITY_DN871_c0_g1~~TRINITY_DN871_c0_g1_i2.p1  ORF type:complete len:1058 (-),score=118.97 TRINITY_DN871_c0_g1_i2:263-3175(-)